MNINLPTQDSGVDGRYRIQTMKGPIVTGDTGWFHNLITDQGLDQIGDPPVTNTSYGLPYLCTHCEVGVGNVAPANTDTALVSPIAMSPPSASSNVEGGTTSYVAGPPPYWKCVFTYTFNAGTGSGNISEVSTGGCLSGDTHVRALSRALVLDGAGAPTTIPWQIDETLVVTYELRYYIDTIDLPYSMAISGVTYTGTRRRFGITNAAKLYYAQQSGSFGEVGWGASTTSALVAATASSVGNIVASTPNQAGIVQSNYTPGTHYRDYTGSLDLTHGNANITMLFTISPHGWYQYTVSPAIPKTSSERMSISFRYSWDRYAP